MKILFLDIDGVLNSELWFTWAHYCITHQAQDKIFTGKDEEERYVDHMIDERLIANLNRIIEGTGCEIVLSSSWRSWSQKENDKLNAQLKRKGLLKEFISVTPRLSSGIRGEEIKKWLEDHCGEYSIDSYCILDDDSDMLEHQKEFFIQTDSYIGLTNADAEKAIEVLNSI